MLTFENASIFGEVSAIVTTFSYLTLAFSKMLKIFVLTSTFAPHYWSSVLSDCGVGFANRSSLAPCGGSSRSNSSSFGTPWIPCG